MKKCCIIFLLLCIITVTGLGFFPNLAVENLHFSQYENENSLTNFEERFLRLHIRAHSNELQAQAVKYLVRDQVIEYLLPIVSEFHSQQEAVEGIQKQLKNIEKVSESVLEKQGFSYGASASVRKENFPTRIYEDLTLPSGIYTALIIELGEGVGDNWWCVVYPPLCFTGALQGKVQYKSKIMEIIRSFTT